MKVDAGPPDAGPPGAGPLAAAALAIVPEAATLDAAGWRQFHATVHAALAQRPARTRRQLALFLHLLDAVCLLRHGCRLQSLALPRRTRLLERIQDSRFLLIRRGFWGLRTLVFMGYYTQPRVRSELSYRAAAAGWRARP